MATGDGDDGVAPRQAHGGRGGVLQGGGEVEQLGPAGTARGIQRLWQQSLLIHRQPHHLILELACITQHAGVAQSLAKQGLSHAAGGQQGQHDAVLGTMAEQQAIFARRDALLGEPVDEQLALCGASGLLVITEQAVEIPCARSVSRGLMMAPLSSWTGRFCHNSMRWLSSLRITHSLAGSAAPLTQVPCPTWAASRPRRSASV